MAEARASWAQAAAASNGLPEMARKALPMLLLGLPFLWRLGAAPLLDVDEGAFAEATREMIASGDWGHTTLQGADRFDKPIGVYWLQMLAMWALGPTPLAARLPSALAAWGMCVAVLRFAQARWGREGAVAAWILATSAGLLGIGRAATADAVLNLLITLAALDLWRHFERGPEGSGAVRRAWAWIGLGLLVKGPVAALVPLAAAVSWATFSDRPRARLAALVNPVGLALAACIAGPWYLYALARHGSAFVDGFFWTHNVARFAGPLEGHGGGLLYYLWVVPMLMLPWTPLVWPLLRGARQDWQWPLRRFLWCWAGFVMAFFSLSGTKLPHYALYGMVPLALLAGRHVSGAGPALQRALWAGLTVWLAILGGLPWIGVSLAEHVADPLYRALLAGAPAPRWPLAAGGLAALACMVAAAASRHAFVPRFGLAALVAALLWAGVAAPWWSEALQGPIVRAALAARGRPEHVVQWRVHWPSAAFAAGQPMPRRDPQPGDLVLTRSDRLPAGSEWETVQEQHGVALVLWRGTR